MKMKIFILLVIGTLIVSHYKNITAAKASPALDENTQETTTIGEPREAETSGPEQETEKPGKAEQAEPEQNKPTKKAKKAEAAADEEAASEQAEEAAEETPATEQKEGKVFSRDEIGAILLCILFCVALICGYLVMHIFFKRG